MATQYLARNIFLGTMPFRILPVCNVSMGIFSGNHIELDIVYRNTELHRLSIIEPSLKPNYFMAYIYRLSIFYI
jgi:hypothetical protein